MLQFRVSLAVPVQSVPPYLGVGFVQVLVLVFVPVPHVLVQSDHLL